MKKLSSAPTLLVRRLAVHVVVHWISSSPILPSPFRVRLLRIAGIPVGDGSHIGGRVLFRNTSVNLGLRTYIQAGCILDPGESLITLEDGAALSYNCVIVAVGHETGPSERRVGAQQSAPVVLGRGCWIGVGVTVLPGVTVGAGTIVGAGSVVTHSLPPNVVAVGSPARVLREISDSPSSS